MNIGPKIWIWCVIVLGALSFVASMSGPEFDAAALVGGVIYVVTGLIALTYVWRDDAVQKQKQKNDEEMRIAAIVESRINK